MTPEAKRKKNQKKKLKLKQKKAAEKLAADGQEHGSRELTQDQGLESVPTSTEDLVSEQELSLVESEPVNISSEDSRSGETPKHSAEVVEKVVGAQDSITLGTIAVHDKSVDSTVSAPHLGETVEEAVLPQGPEPEEKRPAEEPGQSREYQMETPLQNDKNGGTNAQGKDYESISHFAIDNLNQQENAETNKEVPEQDPQTSFESKALTETGIAEYPDIGNHIDERPLREANGNDQAFSATSKSQVMRSEEIDDGSPHMTRAQEEANDISVVVDERAQSSATTNDMQAGDSGIQNSSIQSNVKQENAPYSFAPGDSSSPLFAEDSQKKHMLTNGQSEEATPWDELGTHIDNTSQESISRKSEVSNADTVNNEGIFSSDLGDEEVQGQETLPESNADDHLMDLFSVSHNSKTEVMPWESTKNEYLPPHNSHAIESNDVQDIVHSREAQASPTFLDNNDTKTPQQTVGENQFNEQTASLSFPDEPSLDEKMPWDTSTTGYSTITDQEGSLDAQNAPATAFSQQEDLFPDEKYAGHEKMPWEMSSNEELGKEYPKEIESPNATSQSEVERPQSENGECQTEDSCVEVQTATHKLDETRQVQKSGEESPQLFCNPSETEVEKMPWESSPQIQPDQSHTDTSHLNSLPPNPEAKKFSFLDDDDDILDDDISDADSFLESDEGNSQSPNLFSEQITEEVSDSQPAQSLDSSSSSNFGGSIQNVNRQSSTSMSSHGRLNRYEPSRMPQNLNVPSSEHDRYRSAPNYSSINVGIVPPQPIQPVITDLKVDVAAKQEVFEKFREEKKKSDAYDFPMDLVPDKNKLVHAKPVGVPTPKFFPATSFGSVPEIPSKISTPSNQGVPPSIRASSMPVNPYANIASHPQKKPSHVIQLPPQGIVMPQISLPSSNQTIPPKGPPKASFNGQYPPLSRARGVSNVSTSSSSAIRSRGVSNVSQTIGSPTGGSGIAASIPFPPNVVPGPSPSQIPKQASKYAPSSPINNLNSYGPARRLSNNLPPAINPIMNNIESVIQESHPPSLGLNVPTTVPQSNVLSPTSATSTRRYHARSNSSVYAPNQNEHTSKYAPTVHPQYQNTQPQHQYPLQHKNPTQSNFSVEPASSKWSSSYPESNNGPLPDIALDNQALMHKQFPIVCWGGIDKIVYAIPAENSQNAFIMASGGMLHDIKVVSTDAVIPRDHLLQSFPGPLIKNKTKRKDIEKWLENTCGGLPSDESSTGILILFLLKLKISESATWRDISSLLYNSDELLVYLSQPFMESQKQPTAYKLDATNQMKILAHLQTGGQREALELALQNNDYSIALLIGSLMGKERWSEVVQKYLTDEFSIASDVSHFSANLLSLIFQVFVGNSKKAINEFSLAPQKRSWAVENWKIIVAAILNNINLSMETSSSSVDEVPPVILEFLVEFGLFLAHEGLSLQASVVFIIANLPLSAMPLANSSIKFEHIGNPSTLESAVYSELYEFICSKDPKGFPVLLEQKLHQAFCYQELGMSANAARYVDYLSAILKSMPKKDAHTAAFAHRLGELSVRISGTSSGWLGKPKLSSVWGQLDKSFNKYIGGDDDAIIKKPTEKKVFDGFTPVSSRNSSMLDVSQYQFTPFQASAQQQLYGNRESVPSSNGVNQSPVGNVVSAQGNTQAVHGSFTEPIAHYMPRKISQSSQGSPQKPPHMHSKSATAENPQSQLRRVQTEQLCQKELNINDIYKGSSALKIYRSQENQNHVPGIVKPPLAEFAPPSSLSHTSMHYNSTPNLLRRESSSSTDVAPPPKIKSSTSRQISPSLKRVTPVYSPGIPPSLLQNDVLESAVHIEKVQQADPSPFSESETESLATGTECPFPEKSSSKLENTNAATVFSGQVQPPEVLQEIPNEESDVSLEQADTTVLQSEFPNVERDTWRSPIEEDASQPPLRLPPQNVSESFNTRISTKEEDTSSNNNSNSMGASPRMDVSVELTQPAIESKAQPSFKNNSVSKVSSPTNPYAPSYAFDVGANPYAPKNASISNSPTRRIYVPSQNNIDQQIENSDKRIDAGQNVKEKNSGASLQDIQATKKLERFNPIKAPDVLSPETFVPVIKAPAGRSFTPRVQSPEIQYDDIVEDESESEDENENNEREAKFRQENEERKKLEEEEKRRQKEEKEQLQREKEEESSKSRANNEGQEKSSAWFGWLKKDSNEKKPIKAKLGHKKSTFYYDEKLKRWVNKNSSEEEKEKLSSPPPPPPVVKRMDNGPKTKPQSGREISKEPIGPILPKNPLTGQAMPSNAFSSSQIATPSESPRVTPQLPTSSINLSGKKANGLDDLLTLAGAGTAPRKKKRSTRGYVNVMENT